MDYKEQFIRNLKTFRKENNLTQDDLADMLGYSQKNVAKWEQGFTLPSVDVIIELSKKMGVSLDTLFGLSEKTILDSCIDYVIRVQEIDKDVVCEDEYGEKTTLEEVVGNNVAIIWWISTRAILDGWDFKNEIEKQNNENIKCAVEYLKGNGHIVDKNDKWKVSTTFAIECLDREEGFIIREISREKKELANWKKIGCEQGLSKMDKLELECLESLIEQDRECLEKIQKIKNDLLRKDN